VAQDPSVGREVLPIPDRVSPGLTMFDAKDPANSFPPIEPLRPPEGAPNVLLVLLDDVGFAAGSAFGGPVHMPTAERLAGNGLEYNRFHTTALCAHSVGAADGPEPPRRQRGCGFGGRDVGSGVHERHPQHRRAGLGGAAAQRVLDRPVRQMSRGPDLGDVAGRSDGPVADGRGVRVLLRVPGGRGQPVLPGAGRRHEAHRAPQVARGGLPPVGGSGRQGHRLDASAELAGP
jgi:hypothetical protein